MSDDLQTCVVCHRTDFQSRMNYNYAADTWQHYWHSSEYVQWQNEGDTEIMSDRWFGVFLTITFILCIAVLIGMAFAAYKIGHHFEVW